MIGRMKAEVFVERQCPSVGLLGVDPGDSGTPAAHPVEGVVDQGSTEPLALVVRIDGQPLEKTLRSGSTGDGIADDRSIVALVAHDPQSTYRCGRHGVFEALVVEVPEVVECAGIERKNLGPFGSRCSADLDVGSPPPAPDGAGKAVEFVAQKVEQLAVGEAVA